MRRRHVDDGDASSTNGVNGGSKPANVRAYGDNHREDDR